MVDMKAKSVMLIVFTTLIILFVIWQNNGISVTEMSYAHDQLPKDFQGYKVVHISDLHNKAFGKDQGRLLKKIQEASPDMIVVTGDLIDRRKYDLATSMVLIEGASKIGPVYYVSGNHEAWSGHYEHIRHELQKAGVVVLDDDKVVISKGEASIELLGLSDPAFLTSSHLEETNLSKLTQNLAGLSDENVFQVLLSHRPELFDLYAAANINLTFSGHAHGGQVRLPFVGGLVAPNQGLFPAYTSGAYVKEDSTLVVSRGLGNSIIPLRVFNRPEVVVVTFK